MQDSTQDVITSGDMQENAGSQSSIPQEIKDALDFSFQEQMTPQERQEFQQRIQGEQQEGGGRPAAATGEGATITPTTVEQPQAFDEAKYLKDNFGFETLDEAKAAIQTWKGAGSPQATIEPTFTNEQSKKLYEALKAGKTDEVYQYLEVQRTTANLDNMTPEQQIKLHIKHQYPTLSQAMIDRQYNKMYAVKDEADFDDPLDYQIEKEMSQQKVINDAATARNFFSEYRNKIELPELQPIQTSVDADYEAWKASNAQAQEVYNNDTLPKINAIKEADLATTFKIIDANNQMDFEVPIVVDPQDVQVARQHALNFGAYIENRFYTNGQLDGAKLMQAILRDINFDKYVQTTARQAVNAERKRLIAKESPNPIIHREDNGVGEKSDFQKQMDMAFAPSLVGGRF
jgi:hypothetical protein